MVIDNNIKHSQQQQPPEITSS